MCRSHTDPAGARRCKTVAEESAAKANYRARKKLQYQHSTNLYPTTSPKTAPAEQMTDPAESFEKRAAALLEAISTAKEGRQDPPLTINGQHTALTAAYVQLGELIAERAGSNEALLDEIVAERKAADDRIVSQTERIGKLREQLLASADETQQESLRKELAELSSDTDKLLEARRQKNQKLEKFFTERAESYRSELESFGVEFAGDLKVEHEESSHKGAVSTVNRMLKYFPKEWVEAANRSEPVIIKTSKKRSHYIAATLESRYKLVQNVRYVTKPAGWTPDPEDQEERNYIQIPSNEYGEAEYVNPETGRSMTVGLNDPTDTAWAVPEYEYYRGDDEPSDPRKWEKIETFRSVYDMESKTHTKEPVSKWRRPVRKRQEVNVVSAPKLTIPADSPESDRYVYGASNTESVALHEMTHRLEHHNPDLKNAEKAFITHRAKLYTENAEPLTEITPGEYGYRDNFVSHYMGRDYEGDAYEIASVGFEALWFGKNGGHERGGATAADHEYRNFLLGLLASTAKK